MNFLSHFYHEAPCTDPYFAAGLLLPDILSNYSFRHGEVVKLHANKLVDSDDENLLAMRRGVMRHYEVDGFFHESGFFDSNVRSIKELIRSKKFSCFQKRLYAFAHVLLEIMLDRMLLAKDRRICDAFYSLMDGVDPKKLTAFMTANTTASKPAGITEHFQQFRQLKFIYDYADDGRLLELLSRLNSRLGNHLFNPEDKKLLQPILHEIDKSLLDQKFPKFRTDL